MCVFCIGTTVIVSHHAYVTPIDIPDNLPRDRACRMDDDLTVNAYDFIDDVGDETEVVRNDDDRHAFIEPAKNLEELTFRKQIDVCRGFVEKQKIGFRDKGPRDQDTLPLSAREFAEGSLRKFRSTRFR